MFLAAIDTATCRATSCTLSPGRLRMVSAIAATIATDQAPFIEKSISDLQGEALRGAFFAVIVIFAFLLSVRSTLVTAVSIPATSRQVAAHRHVAEIDLVDARFVDVGEFRKARCPTHSASISVHRHGSSTPTQDRQQASKSNRQPEAEAAKHEDPYKPTL